MDRRTALRRGAIVVLIFGLAISAWAVLDTQRRAQIQTLIDREVAFATDLLVRDLRARYAAASHLGHLWERGRPPNKAQFYADVQEQMASNPGIYSVSYADADFMLRYAAPRAFSALEGQSIAFSDNRRDALSRARDTRQTVLSDPVSLMDQSGQGFLMYVPLFEADVFRGILIVVFRVDLWLPAVYGANGSAAFLPNLALSVDLNGQTLMQSADFQEQAPTFSTAKSGIWHGARFDVQARPRPLYFAEHWHWTPEALAAMVCLALSAMAALASLLRRASLAEASAYETAQELMEVNLTLRDEAEVRRQAEAEAKTARAATARFLATMSHEIRTPLNAIIGMFQLIDAAKDLPAKQRQQAAMGIEAARRLHRDLSNVLDVTRLDAGALRVKTDDCNLTELTGLWASSLEAYVMRSQKPITAKAEIDSSLPTRACVDAAALTQVLNNLMDNAVKFTDAGSVALRVAAEDDTLFIAVADTGLGIAPERRKTIFQRFYQVEEGLERRFSGTGLGLAISRDLVGLMSGDIDVRANTPNGTIFEVRLPGALSQNVPSAPVVAASTELALSEGGARP